MKLLVTLSGGTEGLEVNMARHSDVLAETEHATFSKVLDLVEPAVYEAIRQSIRENIVPNATCFWDGRKFKIVKG